VLSSAYVREPFTRGCFASLAMTKMAYNLDFFLCFD
jgi:hypothetical protein